ncbi:MAG: hypothetical protein LBJ73_02365 [Rickettsiales bacterium]|jgi:hypothetical protein|nr:hypothetical protein [Rickettsiales bacterium]
MKKTLPFVLGVLFCIGAADAAVRTQTAVSRQNSDSNSIIARNESNVSRTADAAPARTARTAATNVARDISARSESNVSRTATGARTARTAAPAAGAARTARTATTATARMATVTSAARSAAIGRSATAQKASTARAAVTGAASKTFGTGYNACRDVYFTCMDQFCAKTDDTYRRCVCSSKLEDIKSKERALGQTGQQLQDFKDFNIDSISKTGAEVKAMLTATPGESAGGKQDKSNSAQQLAGISAVLKKTKSDSLSTQGRLDIAGDINAIWSTTDLAAGADLANLTGEKLYNAVHAQCAAMTGDACESSATLSMVVSAYGMYIENDCSNLSNALGKKITEAHGAIRETEYEMGAARLENYDAHNSTSINDCIAQVRKDITAAPACGPDYVHCLDITGKYLNRDTGEPIYSPDFYQMELQTSLSGDVLSNQTNRMLVSELNRKKEFAARGLDTCRDLSDAVWDEFMRQAVAEIYQGQQDRIRQVKNECIDVVNNCYDTQSKSLKDFSNVKEQLLLGSRMELSEQMCREKLDACSNLYGGGDAGLTEMVNVMNHSTDQKIAQDCQKALQEYAKDICMVPSNDIVHGYPYACRVYTPGEQKYATIADCNITFTQQPDLSNDNIVGIGGGNSDTGSGGGGYSCPTHKMYTGCKEGDGTPGTGYYMTVGGAYNGTPVAGNMCSPCPATCICRGGTENYSCSATDSTCGDYIGSLYQKLVRYALQVCVRPSKTNAPIPTTVLADVNVVMDRIKVQMGVQLSAECERRTGVWVSTPWDTTSNDKHALFYTETSSNTKWGYCKVPDQPPEDDSSSSGS